MKKNDPYTRIQRQPFLILGFMIPLMALNAVIQVFNPHNDLFTKVIFLAPIVLLLLVGVLAIFRYRSNLKRLEQKRECALQGDRSLLAREQPLPDLNILPIPTTIKLDQSRRALLILGLVVALVLFIPFVIGIIFGFGQSHHSPSNNALLLALLIILGGGVLALLVGLVLIFYLLRTQLIFTIVVDEQGLFSTYQGITSSINWSDAHLFAVLNPEKPSVMQFYELSNEHTVVRWVNMPARTLFQRGENKIHAEYRRNVLALLSFVSARTGLPLYNLDPSPSAEKKLLNG
jgi:hypothetical protein